MAVAGRTSAQHASSLGREFGPGPAFKDFRERRASLRSGIPGPNGDALAQNEARMLLVVLASLWIVHARRASGLEPRRALWGGL